MIWIPCGTGKILLRNNSFIAFENTLSCFYCRNEKMKDADWYVELPLQADKHSEIKAVGWQSDNNNKLHTHAVGGAVKRSPGGTKKSIVGRRSSLWLTRSPGGSHEHWRQTCTHSALKTAKSVQSSKRWLLNPLERRIGIHFGIWKTYLENIFGKYQQRSACINCT